MKGDNKRYWDKVAPGDAGFKALTEEQKKEFFGNNERCRRHGNFRCYDCVVEANKKARLGS